MVSNLIQNSEHFEINSVPRAQNIDAICCQMWHEIAPVEKKSLKEFSVEIIFHPSIPDNVTNIRVFDDDAQIIHFLTLEDTFHSSIIDKSQHDLLLNANVLNENEQENLMPKSIVHLDFFFLIFRNDSKREKIVT